MKPFLYQSPTAQIGMTCTFSKKAMGQLLKNSGLKITVEQMGILNQLIINDCLSMNDLAQKTFTDNSAITRIIDNLQKYGMVERKNKDSDRRIKLIHLTEEGKETVLKANEIGKKYVKSVTNNISDKELKIMIDTLIKIRGNISAIFE